MLDTENAFSRTEMLIGSDSVKKLKSSRVAVFGAGGVGGYAIEALARAGVGAIDVIDGDKISVSNINRQILATNTTIGENKVDVAKCRIKDINPECKVEAHNLFFMPDTSKEIDFCRFDYVIDAIDTVTGKKEIILSAKRAGVPIISSMGAGNKLDATAFRVADIYETSVCPLARVMRDICRKCGVDNLKVVYSKEPPQKNCRQDGDRLPASISFVPSVAGLIIAGEVIKDLTK